MEMEYFLLDQDLQKLFAKADQQLFAAERIRFNKEKEWRTKKEFNRAGVYALFEKANPIYIGETGNFNKRMSDLCRTVNHTFRKHIGAEKYNEGKKVNKYSNEVETLLDKYFEENIQVAFIPVNFGRLEIESYMIEKYRAQLVNKPKKRK